MFHENIWIKKEHSGPRQVAQLIEMSYTKKLKIQFLVRACTG